jgi:hypothetical protein
MADGSVFDGGIIITSFLSSFLIVKIYLCHYVLVLQELY